MTPNATHAIDHHEQVLRRLSLLIAVSDVAYALMLSGRVAGDAAYTAAWWTLLALAGVFAGPAAALACSARHGSVRAIKLAASTVAAMFVLVAALWPLAWSGHPLAGSVWLSFVPGLAAMAAALAWPPWPTIAYLMVVTAAVQQVNQQRSPAVNFAFWLELIYSFGFSLVFVAMILEGLRTATALDRTRDLTDRFAADTAATEAQAAQRRTHDTLVHNEVLSTLLVAAKLPQSQGLRDKADIALARIACTPLVGDDQLLAGEQAVRRIRAAIEEGQVPIEVTVRCRDGQVPAEAVGALADGAGEAARNARTHNPPGTRIRARIEVDAEHVAVELRDDGHGFDTARVAPDRLGLRGSLDRVRDIPGGTATLESKVGRGTTVTLQWRRPRPATPDIRQFLGIRSTAAVGVAAVYLAAIGALAVMSLQNRPGWATITALLLYTTMTAVFLLAPGDPIPGWATAAAGLGPIGSGIALVDLSALRFPEQLWPASATAAIYALLLLRGRRAAAWLGQSAVIVLCTAWVSTDAYGWLALMVTRAADFAPLAGCMAFAWLVRPRLASIVELRELNLLLIKRTAAARAALVERAAALTEFDARTAPILSRIADPTEFTPTERRSFTLLEASLRDRLRGGILADPTLIPLLDAARRRGVRIRLYDDQQDIHHTPATRAGILDALAGELTTTMDGQLTVRVLPVGGSTAATILAHGANATRRISIPARDIGDDLTCPASPGRSPDTGARAPRTEAARTS